jgi:hypothetical protein
MSPHLGSAPLEADSVTQGRAGLVKGCSGPILWTAGRVSGPFHDGSLVAPSRLSNEIDTLCPIVPCGHLVVVLASILHLFRRVGKRQDPVGVQALRPKAAIEGFDAGITAPSATTDRVQCRGVKRLEADHCPSNLD